ncbi:MAG: hypothetical protein JY451_02575 [Erythrobacter sp.]|nr:MAG: hypothetical protein JY451_02575 [Erythrobacter sp.]
MIRKLGLLLGVAALGALVTSCGGDDSSTPTPTPTGTSTGTPTPTPTPTSIAFSTTASFSATTTNAGYIVAYFTPTAGGVETFNDGARVNGTSTIDFVASPDSATFNFPDLEDPVVFDAADFVSASATERRYVSGDEALTLFLPFQHVLLTTYQIDSQAFTRGTVAGTLRSQRNALFFNPVTTTSAITTPLTYTGQVQVAGGDPGTTPSGVITATATDFTITPGASSTAVAGTIRVFQTVAGVETLVATIAISDTVSASGGFDGTITDTPNKLTGQYAGILAGPNREEIVIIFSVIDSTADDSDFTEFVGSFIGS